MEKPEIPDSRTIKRTITRMPEDYEPEIEDFSYREYFKRTAILFIGNFIGFLVLEPLHVGLNITSFYMAFIVVISLSILNAILWPILTRVFMPFLVYTFGLGSLFFNALILISLTYLIPGFSIKGSALFLTPFAMTAVNTLLSDIMTIDDNSSYYRSITREAIKRRKNKTERNNGLIILEIDGLAKEILEEAITKGYMPTLKNWIERGSHKLTGWETDLSSQTGASQAGILHGNNENIIAYRWVDKEKGNKIITCGNFRNVRDIEKEISDGDGLLVKNGGSRCNLFSGDSDNLIFTSSKILNIQKMYNNAWISVFSNADSFVRIIVLFFEDIAIELYSQLKHKIKNIRPRINRGFVYSVVRAGTNVFLREVNTKTIIWDMMDAKLDVIYASYLSYDEIAHHSGIRDEDSFRCLKTLDKHFKRIEKASAYSKKHYNFVIQSDHGQCNGATFKQRNGKGLDMFVRSLLPQDMEVYSNLDSDDNNLKRAFVPFNKQKDYILNKYETNLNYVEKYTPIKHTEKKPEDSEVIVLASGNLGMIYLTQWRERLNYETIIGLFPDLIPGLVKNKYIGFILVNSKENGAMIIGEKGIYYLDKDEYIGENPLEVYGENAARHLRRTNSFKNVPDILVNSFYNPDTGEVAAFEELVGSHGGLGGTQTKPFILHPINWQINEDIIGAENVYKLLKRELNKLTKDNVD